mgnify:CR=1 FL=1
MITREQIEAIIVALIRCQYTNRYTGDVTPLVTGAQAAEFRDLALRALDARKTIDRLTRERDEALAMVEARRKCQVIAEAEIERVRGQRDEAYRRGMRDGFDLATEYDNNVRELGIDWTATENELERRMSIPRASAAPSDKLSEEEL